MSAAAAVCAMLVAGWAMSRYGVGLTPDSFVYLGAAESIARGEGVKIVAYHNAPLIPDGAPLTSFPPAYPLLVAAPIKLSFSAAASARLIQILILGAAVFLVGVAICLATDGSFSATLLAILLFAGSDQVWAIFTTAWSDGAFIVFCLAAFVLVILHRVEAGYGLLIGASAVAALAILTRYAGVTLIPAIMLAIFFQTRNRQALRESILCAAAATLPLALWLIRNFALTRSTVSRGLSFHPPSKTEFQTAINSVLALWTPWPGTTTAKIILMLFILVLLVSGSVIGIRKSRDPLILSAFWLSAGFVSTYICFLFTYNTFARPWVDLGARVLAPLYVFINMLAIITAHQFAFIRPARWLWPAFLVVVFSWAAINIAHTVPYVIYRRHNGVGFASKSWHESASIAFMKQSSDSRIIYSNGVDALGFLNGQHAIRLPAKFDPVGWKANPEFDSQMARMKTEILENRAILVYFDEITWRYYLPARDELEQTYNLPILLRQSDGVIYGKQ